MLTCFYLCRYFVGHVSVHPVPWKKSKKDTLSCFVFYSMSKEIARNTSLYQCYVSYLTPSHFITNLPSWSLCLFQRLSNMKLFRVTFTCLTFTEHTPISNLIALNKINPGTLFIRNRIKKNTKTCLFFQGLWQKYRSQICLPTLLPLLLPTETKIEQNGKKCCFFFRGKF